MLQPRRLGVIVALALAALAPASALAKPAKGERVTQVAARDKDVAKKSADAKKSAGAKKSTDAKQSAKDKADKARHGKDKKSGAKGAQSIGAPNHGRLAGAARLKGTPRLRQRANAHSWGLPQLVRLLQDAANKVARKHRGSMLLVGDLSARAGGHLDGHNSHQSGRDADVGFYVMNSKGKPVAAKRFIAFDSKGKARDLAWASFDDARNWALVEALLTSSKAEVRYLFVSNALRGRLLAHAAKQRVNKDLYTRAASVMMSPEDADLHDDHFHVRIACPEAMRDVCVEESNVRPRSKASPSAAAVDGEGGAPASKETKDAKDSAAEEKSAGETLKGGGASE